MLGPQQVQLWLFRFGMTVGKTHPELYDKFIDAPLMDIAAEINKLYGVEITKGMSLDELDSVIKLMCKE